tara:strand:+ start:3372 stop:3614 length:243 start_codon:yes stop_codon:yes gene_type:complete
MLDIEKLKHLIREVLAEEKTNEKKEVPKEAHLYTENEACKFLKISRPTMLKLRKMGKIKYKKLNGIIRYRKSDLLNIKSN